jgi:hypothetical protein
MDALATISLANLKPNSQNFAFVREEGMVVIRRLAPETWTDHNLHDPGITLHEALCYALTEAGFLGALDMADLLKSGEQQAPQEFFTTARVLPSAPVSLRDFQKIFTDHPLVRRAWVSALFGEPLGRTSILLEFEKTALNSNVVGGAVTVMLANYLVEFAFPYWDDPEAKPLQEDVTLVAVTFDDPLTPWRPVEGSDAYFTRIKIDYIPPSGVAADVQVWVVMQVTTPVDDPALKLPLILQQAANLLQLVGPASLLKHYNQRVTEAFETSRVVRRYGKTYRNLCENLAEYNAVRLQEVALSANIEVAPDIHVENLLADIFFVIDKHLSPEIIVSSLAALQDKGTLTEQIFEGPPTHYGFIVDESLDTNLPLNKVFTSDIIRLILQLRKPDGGDIQTRENLTNRLIVAVRNLTLSLYIDNRSVTTGARDCLQLLNSVRHIPRLSPGKCKIVFIRNTVEVAYDMNAAIALFEQKKTLATIAFEADTPDLPLPEGTRFPLDYYPLQNALPLTYGVGIDGLPGTATDERKAQAKQLKGYLFFFEQMLAGYYAQLANVNSFFSARPGVATTLYQQPLYQLPRVSDLFADFDPAVEAWDDFQADQANAYRRTLNTALETEDQFLDRRHRMLDHLLSRHGESLDDFMAMAYRQIYATPAASAEIQEQRRRSTAHRLLREKAAFYYDLPDLHQARLQSFGLPAWRTRTLIRVTKEEAGVGWAWQIFDFTDTALWQQEASEPTATAAQLKGEEVMLLSTVSGNYSAGPDVGGFRIRVSSGAVVVAKSAQLFATLADATTAIPLALQRVVQTWVRNNLAPLERRLYHLLEIGTPGDRRQLQTPVTDYFEIYNDAIIGKRFRLRETTDPLSTILLESETNFLDVAATLVAIDVAIASGLVTEHYDTTLPALGPFEVRLMNSAGAILARSPGTFATPAAANMAADSIRQLLYRHYSVEGFYMVEHILLYPVATADPLLAIEDASNPCQPTVVPRKDTYSFQMTFVFPSGYVRKVATREPCQPGRFRDLEFRDYAERTIRKACPGHILPVVLWVDRLEGALPGDACFENFETRYRAWLAAYFTDEVPEAVIGPLRNSLVDMLNKLYAMT